jgi:hypothetical protein
MNGRIKTVLAAAALLAITFGVIDSQAGRSHRHRVAVKHLANSVTVPPAGDPATAGVKGVGVSCPAGYSATGGGYDFEAVGFVPFADLFPRRYSAIAVNETQDARLLTVTVACIKGRTSARRASATASLESRVKRLRAQR